jgi:predicted nuclease with TOPRIM domain
MSNQNPISRKSKTELIQEREKLREKLTAIEADYRKGLDPDSDDQAIELENADVLEGIAAALADELSEIEKRLAEME